VYNELQGQWSYGFASGGTVTLPVGATLLQVVAQGGASGGNLTIFGGATIAVAAGQTIPLRFLHRLAVAGATPTVVTTSTCSAFVEWAKPGSSI
jgi:hypothetical protein